MSHTQPYVSDESSSSSGMIRPSLPPQNAAFPAHSLSILIWCERVKTPQPIFINLLSICFALCAAHSDTKKNRKCCSQVTVSILGDFYELMLVGFFCINLLALVNVASTVCEKHSNVQVHRVSSLAIVKVSCFSWPIRVDYVYQAAVPAGGDNVDTIVNTMFDFYLHFLSVYPHI